MTDFVFIGGDMRMVYAARRLSERHGCTLMGFDSLTEEHTGGVSRSSGGRYDAAVLPIFTGGAREIRCPYANRSYDISILPKLLRTGGSVFAGKVFPGLEQLCAEHGYVLCDYLAREELAVRNAVLTAEGAVMTLISETEASVHGSDILILGFGRIGKLCARYFSALGANVTVAARRKSDLAWAEAYGCKAADITDETAFRAALAKNRVIVNTAPAKLLTAERADYAADNALLIELASLPCTEEGVKIRIVQAGGLPGKTAPEAAGAVIADTIGNILKERSAENG